MFPQSVPQSLESKKRWELVSLFDKDKGSYLDRWGPLVHTAKAYRDRYFIPTIPQDFAIRVCLKLIHPSAY